MISYLADEMARLLYHTGMAAQRLELGWQLVDGGRHRHNIYLSRPSRQAALFHRLLAGVSDRINPEFGIEAGWMQAHDCSPLAPLDQPLHHMPSFNDVAIDENYASLIDRLVARFGYGSVVSLQPRARWQPESAQQTRCLKWRYRRHLLRGQAGLPRRNLSPRRRALFGCWPIRILLMWWRCCQIIRQRNLYGNAAHIKLSKPLAQNVLPRHGGWHRWYQKP